MFPIGGDMFIFWKIPKCKEQEGLSFLLLESSCVFFWKKSSPILMVDKGSFMLKNGFDNSPFHTDRCSIRS